LDTSKVLEGSRTLFMKKQKVKVETLAFAGCGTMHTSDHFGSCGFVLARTPFCGFAIPGVVLRDLAVKKTASLRADTIELEPGRKSGVLETGLLQSGCFVSFLEENWLLIWHVDRETLDVMGTTSKREFQESPDCLRGTHIACIHMVLDFIHADLQGGAIVALVAILVEVFPALIVETTSMLMCARYFFERPGLYPTTSRLSMIWPFFSMVLPESRRRYKG
jgi:hypothetical protein